MSAQWLGYFFDETQLAGSELIVALAIADHADSTGRARPGMNLLAQKSRLDVRQVRRICRRLETSGYLSTIVGRGRGKIQEFQLIKKRTPAPAFKVEEKRTRRPGFNGKKSGHVDPVLFPLKADISDHKSGHLGTLPLIEPLEPLNLNQLINAVSIEKPETDRRIISIGILQTLIRRTDLVKPGRINSLSYFDPEITKIDAEAKAGGSSSRALDALLERRTEQYNSLVNQA